MFLILQENQSHAKHFVLFFRVLIYDPRMSFFPDQRWKRLFENARAGSAANEALTEDQWMTDSLKTLKDFLREESKLVLESVLIYMHTCWIK